MMIPSPSNDVSKLPAGVQGVGSASASASGSSWLNIYDEPASYASRRIVLMGADDSGVAADRDRDAEIVTRRTIGSGQLLPSLQTVPLRVNTYAEPAFAPPGVSSPKAPTMAVSPLIATEQPKTSFAAPSEAVSFCCSLQTVPLRVKTYAEPACLPACRHIGTDDGGVAADRDRAAEIVTRRTIGSGQLLLLAPDGAASREYVCRACILTQRVVV